MIVSPTASSARAGASSSAESRNLPLVVAALCVVLLASIVVVVVLGSRLTFFSDDWDFLLQRPGLESRGGLDVLLAPHNSNLVVLTAGLYKLLVAVFGLGSQVPFRIVLGVAIAAVGIMIFLLVSRRMGQLVGLACAAVVAFLGQAWEDLLFFASIDLVGSLATGLAALWLLERDRPRTGLACFMLVCSVGFSNVGVPFAVGAAVAVLLQRRPARLWVAALPLALFGVWWLTHGNSQPSNLSGNNLGHLPRYVLDSVSSGLASMLGLSQGTASGTDTPWRILLGVAAAGISIALIRGWRPRPTVLVPAVVALSFWCLTGASFTPGREPFASRYQLIDVALLILIGAELLGQVHFGRIGLAVMAVVTVAVIASNADSLAYGYRFMREQSRFVKADLGALELGGRLAPPNLWLIAPIAHDPYLSGVTAGRFFADAGAHGRVPVYTSQQIAVASDAQRQGADNVLALAERLTPSSTGPTLTSAIRCAHLAASAGGVSTELALRPATSLLLSEQGGRGLGIGVRRFASPGAPAYIGLIAPGLTERMTIPRDGITIPWKLSVKNPAATSPSHLRVCPTR